jgi:hypothetical protein
MPIARRGIHASHDRLSAEMRAVAKDPANPIQRNVWRASCGEFASFAFDARWNPKAEAVPTAAAPPTPMARASRCLEREGRPRTSNVVESAGSNGRAHSGQLSVASPLRLWRHDWQYTERV